MFNSLRRIASVACLVHVLLHFDAAQAKWIDGNGIAGGSVSESVLGLNPNLVFYEVFSTGNNTTSGSVDFIGRSDLSIDATAGARLTLKRGIVGVGFSPGSTISVSGVPSAPTSAGLRLSTSAGFSWQAPEPWLELSIPELVNRWNSAPILFPMGRYTVQGDVAPGDIVSVSVSIEMGPNGSVFRLALPSETIDTPGPFSFSDFSSLKMSPSEVFGPSPYAAGIGIGGNIGINVSTVIGITKGSGGGTTTVSLNPPDLSVTALPEPSSVLLSVLGTMLLGLRVRSRYLGL